MGLRQKYFMWIALLWPMGNAWAQFTGGVADGHARATLLSTVACQSFFGLVADGHARAVLPNPDPCDYFDGSSADGSARAAFVNPDTCGYFDGGRADGGSRAVFVNLDTCGYFDGGRADGNSRGILLSAVPCTAFMASQRDGAASGFLSCAPLTVTASELYGYVQGKDGYLWWYTYSEVNNLGFILQRSSDQLNWTDLGFLPGESSSNARLKYDLWDRDMQPGVNYYRWEQIDLAGSTSRSNIVALVRGESGLTTLTVFPNPVGQGNFLHLNFQSPDEADFVVHVVDALGHVLYSQDVLAAPSPIEVDIDTAPMSSGIYFLVLKGAHLQLSRRFVVH